MTRKLIEGLESVGHVEGLAEDLNAAYLKLDDRGAIVSLPRVEAVDELFSAFADKDESGILSTLRFHDTKGVYVLSDRRAAGGAVSSRGVAVTRVRAPRVIDAGENDLVYADVDGMTTELDGLSTWTGMSTVTHTLETKEARPNAIVLRAENQEEIFLGGRAAAKSSRPSASVPIRRATSLVSLI
jgi:hypothetical protein